MQYIYLRIDFISQISFPEVKLERDVFVYRSYIAQKKYRIVVDEISDKSALELQALKLLAEFLSTPRKR